MKNDIQTTSITIKRDTETGNVKDFLDAMLRDISPMSYDSENMIAVETNSIEDFRKSLVEGGFGDDTAEELADTDDNLLEEFFSKGKKKVYQMLVNKEILNNNGSEYQICGVYREETNKYYMLSLDQEVSNIPINSYGLIVSVDHFLKMLNKDVKFEGYDFFGAYINDAWIFYSTDDERSHIAVNYMDMVTRLFSRNTGLLESSIMNAKTALIVGCGSVGSLIALELARAGVGKFILVDGDTLEVHNICRHQLGFRDIGRYKVDAVADAIQNINPFASIRKYKGILQDLPEDFVMDIEDGIVIGTGDNRESSAFANELAKVLNIPFVSTGCWQRAHAGECFFWYPNADLPMYREAFSDLISDERPVAHQNYFADDYDEDNLNFEPGVSTDIGFVTMIAIKIIYDLLNMNNDGYTKRVIGYLTNYTLICNTNEAVIGGKNAEIFPHPLYISNKITVGNGQTSGKKKAV